MAGVIRCAACGAVMGQAQGVACLVGSCISHIFLIAVPELVREDKGRCIAVPVKGADLGNDAGVAIPAA